MGSEVGSTRRRDDIGLIRTTANIYVSPTGSDSNSGVYSTSPFRTIQKAFNYLKKFYILEGGEVIINLAAGVYRISSELLMDHPQGERITIAGAAGVTKQATAITSYTDTTSYSGKVGGKTYQSVRRSLNEGPVPTSGERFDMTIRYNGGSGIPQTTSAIGKYIIVSPLDSSYEVQLNKNTASLLNGVYADNTDPQRYTETESTMRRFFAYGGHSIKTNAADFGVNPIVDNRTRNRNIYDGVNNTVTSRVHTFSTPVGTNIYSSGNSSVDTRYVSSVIQVIGDVNAIRIRKSSLNIRDVAIEARDPLTSTASPVTSSGIVVDEQSVLTLKQGVVVKGFGVGIEVKNKSLLNQESTTVNQFNALTYCKIGLLVSDGSTAVLTGVVANGCWGDGFVFNSQSIGDLSSCVAVGCGRHGFLATRNSNLVAVRCVSAYNMQNVAQNFSSTSEGGFGFGCRLNSNLECVGCLSFRNGYGYFTDKNSSLNVSSSDSKDNVNAGVNVSESSNAVIGPYCYSYADTHGQYVTDCSFAKTMFSEFHYCGFETPSGVSGSAFTTAAASNLNLYNVTVANYAKNAIEAIYNSFVSTDTLTVTENASTQGDSINCTYQSVARLAGTCLGTKEVEQYSLLNGYVELNGVELDGN